MGVLPQLGARVAVWSHDDGIWQEGFVLELNFVSGQLCIRTCSSIRTCPSCVFIAGEFLVDFDDEMEGQAWTSQNQTWKFVASSSINDEEATQLRSPSLGGGVPVEKGEMMNGNVTSCASRQAILQPTSRCEPMCSACNTWSDSALDVRRLFHQLYEEIVLTDG